MEPEVLIIGFIVSMVFYELVGLYPGGIVVPAFLAFYITEPYRILGTVIIAVISLFLYRLFSAHFILFGRRRFFVLTVTAGLLTMALGLIYPNYLYIGLDFRAIGIVIPGLLANTCQKQGILITLASAIITMTMIYLLSRLLFVY